MKLFSYVSVSCLVLALVACEKSSDKKSDGNQGEAAVTTDDPAVCSELQELALHEVEIEGYTDSEGGKFKVKVDWPNPLIAGDLNNKATVTFLNHHGEAFALNLVSFKLFMPSMGHGTIKSDKLVFTQNQSEKNIWDVDQIYFSMGGMADEWVVDVEAGACGITDKARVSIPVEVQ